MVFAAIRLSLPPRLRYRKRPQKRCPMRAEAHSREHAKAQHLSLGFACPEDSWSGGLPGCCRSVHGREPVTVDFTSLKGCVKHGFVEQALYSHGNQVNSFCFCLFHPTTLPRLALISALVTTPQPQKHPQETLGEGKKMEQSQSCFKPQSNISTAESK